MSDVPCSRRVLNPNTTRVQGYKTGMTSTYPSSSRVAPFLHNYSQKETPDVDVYGITRSVLLDGTEQVVSHAGTSQYSRDGTGAAACGLAALNFARVAFLKEQNGLRNSSLLQAVLSRECAEVRHHCLLRLSAQHSLIFSGNYCSLRAMVRKPSSGGFRHLPRSRIRENFGVEDHNSWSSWSSLL